MKFVVCIGPSKKRHDLSKVWWVGFIVPSCRHVSNQAALFRILQSHVGRNGWSHSMTVPIHKSVPTSTTFSLLYLKEALDDKLTCRCLLARQQKLCYRICPGIHISSVGILPVLWFSLSTKIQLLHKYSQ